VNGYNLNRLLALLEAPVEIQNAVARDLLTKESAGKIIRLSEDRQRQVVELVRSLFAKEDELGPHLADRMEADVRVFLDQLVTPRRGSSSFSKMMKAIFAAVDDDEKGKLQVSTRDASPGRINLLNKARRMLKRIQADLEGR